MHWAEVQTVRLGTRQECVKSLLRVSGACLDRAREFARRRLRLAGRLSGVAERLAGSWGGLDDVVGAHRKFARRFTEGIGKLARNTSGDRRRKTVRLTVGDSEEEEEGAAAGRKEEGEKGKERETKGAAAVAVAAAVAAAAGGDEGGKKKMKEEEEKKEGRKWGSTSVSCSENRGGAVRWEREGRRGREEGGCSCCCCTSVSCRGNRGGAVSWGRERKKRRRGEKKGKKRKGVAAAVAAGAGKEEEERG
ncbi:hypothetical protein BHM03_00054448, partial [Ensete ventricosum]